MAGITVGFIGTGAMGEHMCRNVAKKSKTESFFHDFASHSQFLGIKQVSFPILGNETGFIPNFWE